uniref:Uncharacterized protein n=1 Tax=Cyprinus carpio TaxID=7962 RepID=A0A8C2FA06_CYPCA
MADDVLFEFLHMEIVAHVYREHERVTCVSTLEVMGFRVGQGLIERYTQLYMFFFFIPQIIHSLLFPYFASIMCLICDNTL